MSERRIKIMESRRKKPDGNHYGFWHQGRHSDMPLEGSEADAQTSVYQPDTVTFPQRRTPLWVVLSVMGVACLVSGMVAVQMISNSGGSPPTEPPAAVIVMPSKSTAAKPQTARTRTVQVPGPTTTVRVPVPGPTVTVMARPTPVPGPTVTVTRAAKPKPAKTVRVTVTTTVTEPGPTETICLDVDLIIVPCP